MRNRKDEDRKGQTRKAASAYVILSAAKDLLQDARSFTSFRMTTFDPSPPTFPLFAPLRLHLIDDRERAPLRVAAKRKGAAPVLRS
jgi:hypothetical protein